SLCYVRLGVDSHQVHCRQRGVRAVRSRTLRVQFA
ncbi:hypothetical protein PR002_g33100, partial [Phytophthora rubi]